MKKLLALVLVLSVLLSGCSFGGVSQEEYDDLQADYDELKEEFDELEEEYDELRDAYKALTGGSFSGGDAPVADAPAADAPAVEAPTYGFSEDEVLSQLSTYQFELFTDWGNYAFLEIENLSDYTFSGSAEVKFYDDAGNLVGVSDNYIDVCEPGAYTLVSCYSSEDFAWAEFDLSVYEETYYRSVTRNLSWDSTTATDKEIVTIYNDGDETASSVYVQMLFYLGDELVDYYSTYSGDIGAGDSDSMEMYCYEEYDNYVLYYSGYTYY